MSLGKDCGRIYRYMGKYRFVCIICEALYFNYKLFTEHVETHFKPFLQKFQTESEIEYLKTGPSNAKCHEDVANEETEVEDEEFELYEILSDESDNGNAPPISFEKMESMKPNMGILNVETEETHKENAYIDAKDKKDINCINKDVTVPQYTRSKRKTKSNEESPMPTNPIYNYKKNSNAAKNSPSIATNDATRSREESPTPTKDKYKYQKVNAIKNSSSTASSKHPKEENLDTTNDATTPDPKTRFKCHICNKSITFKYKKMHFEMHANLNLINCDKCGKRFNVRRALRRHERIHAKGYTKPTCDLCGKVFEKVCEIRKHMIRHSSEKPYNCDICHKHYISRIEYEAHRRKHRNERPFQCYICGSCFFAQSQLHIHFKRFHIEKAYKCDICPHRFILKSILTAHKIVHTGERPFECKICGKSFATQNAKTQHTRLHDKQKRYKCKICDKTFAQSSGRRFHEKSKHLLVI